MAKALFFALGFVSAVLMWFALAGWLVWRNLDFNPQPRPPYVPRSLERIYVIYDDLPAGHVLTEDDLVEVELDAVSRTPWMKGPTGGPVVGNTLVRSVSHGQFVSVEDLRGP